MHNSKAIEVLKSFSAKQLRRLEEFVASPYFNTNSEIIAFLQYLKQFAPRFVNKKLERKTVWKNIFSKKKYDEKKLGYLMSDLVHLCEQFLGVDKFFESPIHNYYQALRAYDEKGLTKNFIGTMKEAREELDKYKYRNADFFYYQYLLEEAEKNFFERQYKHEHDLSLQRAADNLDLYYLTMKLRYSCEILNRKNVVGTDYHLRLHDEILLYLNNHPFEEIPAIEIYHQILLTLTESDNETHFFKLKEMLAKHADKFPVDEAKEMYDYSKNYCTKKINTGNMKYLKESFILFQTELQKGIIFVDGFLTPWDYKNIVTVALRIGEFDWAEKFINDYKEQVAPDFRENAFAYNLAYLHFQKREFNKAHELLRQVEFTDVVYQLSSKRTLMKIYYELNETEALISLIDSFKIYLKRNKLISDYQRTIHLNLLKFINQLLKITSGDKKSSAELRKAIETTKHVGDIEWLLTKVDEIIKRN